MDLFHLKFYSIDIKLEEKTLQVKWPNEISIEKQTENLLLLQQIKQSNTDNVEPTPLIIDNNQAQLIDNFQLIKQRYSTLADFNLSKGRFLLI